MADPPARIVWALPWKPPVYRYGWRIDTTGRERLHWWIDYGTGTVT